MEKVKVLLEKYKFQYHRSYIEDGIEHLCFYDKCWGPEGGAKLIVNLYEDKIEIYRPGKYFPSMPLLYSIQLKDFAKVKKVIKQLYYA